MSIVLNTSDYIFKGQLLITSELLSHHYYNVINKTMQGKIRK